LRYTHGLKIVEGSSSCSFRIKFRILAIALRLGCPYLAVNIEYV
jgi:hypothetical protein